jgi:hypothetical protein
MNSISPNHLRTAVCDQEGFYPFRSLVTGGLESIEELALAERFVRTVVLHDAIRMDLQPMPAHDDEDEWTEEQVAAGVRPVIVAFGPDLRPYDRLFTPNDGPDRRDYTRIEISDSLRQLAVELSDGQPGNVYHDAQLNFLQRLTQTLRDGASIVCGGEAGIALRRTAATYPDAIFSTLDRDLQDFAREAAAAHVGVSIPPVLSVVLGRIGSRDHIVETVCALRDEWKEPRDRMWTLIDQMRTAGTVRDFHDVRAELERASAALSPARAPVAIEPTRVFWDLVGPAAALGATVATGNELGETVAAVTLGARAVRDVVIPAANYLFGRGALDLARRVRSEIIEAAELPTTLDRFLTQEERRAMGRANPRATR